MNGFRGLTMNSEQKKEKDGEEGFNTKD